MGLALSSGGWGLGGQVAGERMGRTAGGPPRSPPGPRAGWRWRVPCSAGRGSRSVTAGGGRAAWVWLPPPPPPAAAVGPYRPEGAPRCRVAPGTPVGEWGVSGAGGPRSCRCGRRRPGGLCPRGGRRLPGTRARARARARAPPLPPAPAGEINTRQ